MPGNMNNLMKQAQRMQRQMEESAKELETAEFTATAGGGAVEVTVTGKKEVTRQLDTTCRRRGNVPQPAGAGNSPGAASGARFPFTSAVVLLKRMQTASGPRSMNARLPPDVFP